MWSALVSTVIARPGLGRSVVEAVIEASDGHRDWIVETIGEMLPNIARRNGQA